MGLGTTGTSAPFLTAIVATVAYLAITKRDQTPAGEPAPAAGVARLAAGQVVRWAEPRVLGSRSASAQAGSSTLRG